jgi:hypothetical protein
MTSLDGGALTVFTVARQRRRPYVPFIARRSHHVARRNRRRGVMKYTARLSMEIAEP